MSTAELTKDRSARSEGSAFGRLLKEWRGRRGFSQLGLALAARTTQRHVSFIESGRAIPSRDMVLRLGATMAVPLRQQNALLLVAGYAPAWQERDLSMPDLAAVNSALDHMLSHHEPYPAFVVDRCWNLLRANRGASNLTEFLLGSARAETPPEPVNLAMALVSPDGLRPYIVNWQEVVLYFVRGVQADAHADGAPATASLLKRLLGFAGVAGLSETMPWEADRAPVLPIHIRRDDTSLRLFTTIATLGTPRDVTLEEIRIEFFFPMDDPTAHIRCLTAGRTADRQRLRQVCHHSAEHGLEAGMQVGFFFWPFSPDLVTRMAQAAERYGYDMIGIADTPGNAMDPWVGMVLAARSVERPRIALCVGNLTTRHPATTATAIASIDLIAPERAVLGIGTGHSSPRNLGIPVSPAGDLEEGLHFLRALLTGTPASYRGGEAHLPWITRPSPVFLAASGPKALAIAGRAADGAFINFGLLEENLAHSKAVVASSATASGRNPGDVELWQIAALDCQPDAGTARGKIGAILGFMAGGYILRSADLAERGVPEHLQPAIRELRCRYSTRPGAADAALVSELGLFDYLADRFAIFGTPDDCRAQLLRAQQAGLERVMFTVSLASDPLATVELFGREVLPAFH